MPLLYILYVYIYMYIRAFATDHDVNIILVIHPKKEDDKAALGISSIFGTAKATQVSTLRLHVSDLQ